jgi:hypothetical protein
MNRHHWAELSAAIADVEKAWRDARAMPHPTGRIVRCHAWAAIHDRPISWACDEHNWLDCPRAARPPELPSQPTLSRRCRTKAFDEFMTRVGARLAAGAGPTSAADELVKRIDGKSLPVAAHSKDRDAEWGRGAGQQVRGYKRHCVWGRGAMPLSWAVTSLDVVEKRMAVRLILRLDDGGGGGGGYILGDGHFDKSELHDVARATNYQLVAPRQHPGKGLGHHYQSDGRLRSIEMTEVPAAKGGTDFGASLLIDRRQIERDFGNMVSFGGGLNGLPAWVRRPWRVRAWVHAKLLINAARIRYNRTRRAQKQSPGDPT